MGRGAPRSGRKLLTALLTARDLGLYRGDRRLFRDLGFALERGAALVVGGPNGCGKTSLLRVVAGLLDPDAGEVLWQGRDTRTHGQAFRNELAWYGHRPGLKHDLTLRENLAFEMALRTRGTESLEAVTARLGIQSLLGLPVRALSAGQQRRAALCRLLLGSAPLWVLDEPYTNLDRDGQQLIDELLREHLAAGGLCVVASHRPVTIDAPLQQLVMT